MGVTEVLVVDDELSIREYLEVLLSREGYRVHLASGLSEARACMDRQPVELVLSDLKLGRDSGLDVLRAARSRKPPPEVILLTAFGTPSSAVEAMREGAYDYISKPFDNEELKVLVQKALEKRGLREENSALKQRLAIGGGQFFTGDGPAMQELWRMIEKVASSRSTVLISGESGTGKELVARAIHYSGARASHRFMPVNCAAIAESILESELFGHVRGAFTGATSDNPGLLAAAKEGTVFLDEIGELSLAMQVKLLRVLQERTVRAVGSAREVPFQARIVAATNRNLEREVAEGRFREDLFYRINVISLELPPLRNRREDIIPLANHFLERLRQDLAKPGLSLTPEALELLQQYSYPGNVRQLQNVVERAATLADQDELGPELLPASFRGERDMPEQVLGDIVPEFSLERLLDAEERRYLLAALAQSKGVKTRAASLLGLTFRSFRYRLAKHGLTGSDEANESTSN